MCILLYQPELFLAPFHPFFNVGHISIVVPFQPQNLLFLGVHLSKTTYQLMYLLWTCVELRSSLLFTLLEFFPFSTVDLNSGCRLLYCTSPCPCCFLVKQYLGNMSCWILIVWMPVSLVLLFTTFISTCSGNFLAKSTWSFTLAQLDMFFINSIHIYMNCFSTAEANGKKDSLIKNIGTKLVNDIQSIACIVSYSGLNLAS